MLRAERLCIDSNCVVGQNETLFCLGENKITARSFPKSFVVELREYNYYVVTVDDIYGLSYVRNCEWKIKE